jgi:hypothetical protein
MIPSRHRQGERSLTQNNVLVLGLPPADPRAVVVGLARRIASGELAARLVRERLYEIDMEAALAASPTGEALRQTVRAIGLAARNRSTRRVTAGASRMLLTAFDIPVSPPASGAKFVRDVRPGLSGAGTLP